MRDRGNKKAAIAEVMILQAEASLNLVRVTAKPKEQNFDFSEEILT